MPIGVVTHVCVCVVFAFIAGYSLRVPNRNIGSSRMHQELSLKVRDGLPEALRVLVHEFPRTEWEASPHFGGTVQFWQERHMMFRKQLEMLQTDSQAMLEQTIEPGQYAERLSKFGGMLLNQLHGHHQIEDNHYFSLLVKLDHRIEAGFDILDKDHNAMDGLLNGFALSANSVLENKDIAMVARDKTGDFRTQLQSFEHMLNRHLIDEEELIVPVILKNGGAGLG